MKLLAREDEEPQDKKTQNTACSTEGLKVDKVLRLVLGVVLPVECWLELGLR